MWTRERLLTSALAYLVVVGLLGLVAVWADRYPVGITSIGLALLAPPLGAGLLGRNGWLLAFVFVTPIVAFALAYLAEDYAILVFVYGLAAGAAALLMLPLGVAVGRRIDPRRASGAGAALMVVSLVVVPATAVLKSRRTVTVERARSLAVDERAGSYRGAGLGDRVPEVRARLGRGERLKPDFRRRLGVGPDLRTGYGPTDQTGEELRYGRDLAFALDGSERVKYVLIAQRRAQTLAGVGPGDSLSRFREVYPRMRCGEGDAEPEGSEPYPACRVRITADRWLYVAGTYAKPGQPAVFLVLSRTRLPY